VAPATAERKRDRERRSPPSGPAHTLLIVEPHWRHVRHHNREKRSDIDAGFHRRCDAEEIEIVGEGKLLTDWNILE
jgi:hypothetical protein